MAKRFDLAVFAGDAKNIRIPVVDEDNANAPYNMTGHTLTWTIRRGDNGPPVLQITSPAITVTDDVGTGDLAIIPLAAADTVVQLTGALIFPPGAYAHALKDETAEAVLSYGTFKLNLSAAR